MTQARTVLTLPNLISMLRIALVPVFLWLMFGPDRYTAAGWLLAGIGATDWVDGYLARRLGQVSELGKFLDPLADRLAVAAAVIAGWITGTLPWWFAAALVVRESVVAAGAAYLGTRAGGKLAVRRLGKAATLAVYVAVPNFIAYAGTGYAVHHWAAWIFGVPGLVMYYIVLIQYLGDIEQAVSTGVSSEEANQEGAG